jgi:galactokinase
MAAGLSSGDERGIGNLCRESFRGAGDLYEIGAPSMHAMMDTMTIAPGVAGACQAGAGFGGCMVAIVGREQAQAFADSTRSRYLATTGIRPDVYAVRGAGGAGVINQFAKEENYDAG